MAFPPVRILPITATFLFSILCHERCVPFRRVSGRQDTRDDLRHNMVNLGTSAMTPITLPTWGHMAQVAKRVHTSGMEWAFLKGDRASEYKQLPLGPKYANLTAVALRNHSSVKWMAIIPRALLFGAASAVIHYNCFSRALAVLLNQYFPTPISQLLR